MATEKRAAIRYPRKGFPVLICFFLALTAEAQSVFRMTLDTNAICQCQGVNSSTGKSEIHFPKIEEKGRAYDLATSDCAEAEAGLLGELGFQAKCVSRMAQLGFANSSCIANAALSCALKTVDFFGRTILQSITPATTAIRQVTEQDVKCFQREMHHYYWQHPEVEHLAGGCEFRAWSLIDLLNVRCGVRPSQIWMVGSFSPVPGINWKMHSAATVLKDGKFIVLDPAFSRAPLTYEEWYRHNTAVHGSGESVVSDCRGPQYVAPGGFRVVSDVGVNVVKCRFPCYGQLKRDYRACGNDGNCKRLAKYRCDGCEDRCSREGIARTDASLGTCDSVALNEWEPG